MKKQYFKLSIPILIFISCNETQIKNNKIEELEKEISYMLFGLTSGTWLLFSDRLKLEY